MLNIPIFLSSDDNYAPFIATTIASICDNTKSFCEFYVLDGGIVEENKAKICELKKQFNNFSIEFISIDLEKYFKESITTTYLSKSTYSRFLISNIKPQIEKAIYIDIDIIALGDIQKLFEIDLEDKTIGAIADQGDFKTLSDLKEKLDLPENHQYFNAGVLLINLKQWREECITNKLFEIEKEYQEKLQFLDQDILNIVFKNNYKILDDIYNLQYSTKNAIIRHFVNVFKPWKANYIKIGNSVQFLAGFDEFWKYAQMTKFKDILKTEYEKNINSNMLVKRLSMIAEKSKGQK